MRRIILDNHFPESKQKIVDLFSKDGTDFYFAMVDPLTIRFILAVDNCFNSDFYVDDFKDYLVYDFPVTTDEVSCSKVGIWFKLNEFSSCKTQFIDSMTKAEYIGINLDRGILEPTNEKEDWSSHYDFSTSGISWDANPNFMYIRNFDKINTDIVIPFIKKFGSDIKQIFKISRKDNKDMIFSEGDGIIIYKIGEKLYTDEDCKTDKLFFSYHNAERIRYYVIFAHTIFWFDENKNLIKFNNFIDMDDEKNIFNVEPISENKMSFNRKDFIDIFNKIDKISFNELSCIKIKFSKTKIKIILVNDLSVKNLTLEIPVKNSKLITGNMVFSANYFYKFLKNCEAEKIDVALFRDELLRIECDDANMFFSVVEEH